MQEVEKTVDIDTSGPDTEVEINQEEQSTDTAAVESTETSSTEPSGARCGRDDCRY